jgi:hypothetical protein
VSRVGGNAQIKAMKQVAGRLRLDLAQYRELEAFAEFGSELDRASQAQLERGERVVEVLKQPQYQPMPVEKQVMSIYAVTNGYLDRFPVADAKRFENEFLEYMESRHPEVGRHIAEKGDLPQEVEDTLKRALDEFSKQFSPSEERPGGPPAEGGPVDERRPDVGWDRVGEEAAERQEGEREEARPREGGVEEEATEPGEGTTEEVSDEARETERQGGPAGDTDAPPPPG